MYETETTINPLDFDNNKDEYLLKDPYEQPYVSVKNNRTVIWDYPRAWPNVLAIIIGLSKDGRHIFCIQPKWDKASP